MFIKSRFYLDDEYVDMTRNKFLQYTRLDIPEFRNTLIQHMESVKKSIGERAQHKMEYESLKMFVSKMIVPVSINIWKLEAQLYHLDYNYIMENNVLKSGQQSQFLKEKGNEAKVKHDIDVIETINIELEHKVATLLKENETLKRHYKEMFDSIKTTRAKNIEHTTSLIATNDKFKAQIQEKGFAVAALKNELRKLTGNSVNTKFTKPSILGKPVGQPLKNQSVVRQPTAFKSERPRISKPRFASQVDVNNNLLKPVTTHYLPKRRESAPAKPHHMIAPSSSRYSSNDIVHNHYLEEAKKKAQEHSRIPRNFSDSKHFVCSTCQKCVFNANHYACRFEMSLMGEMKFFLGLQIHQSLKAQKHLKEVKRIFKYLKGTINMGLWYPKDNGFELIAFSDADYAGCIDTRKSTSRGIQFLGDKLVSWISKKQNYTAMSSAEAEYVTLSVVRLGINPMIQPEPEDLPKDNPKLEIAVLRWQSAPASEY
ncbi:hypothetical protein Tco_0211657 [Tanacetum coccineum]